MRKRREHVTTNRKEFKYYRLGKHKMVILYCLMEYEAVLADNDAYHALESVGGLLVTGPTGTNVNDAAVALLYAKAELNT